MNQVQHRGVHPEQHMVVVQYSLSHIHERSCWQNSAVAWFFLTAATICTAQAQAPSVPPPDVLQEVINQINKEDQETKIGLRPTEPEVPPVSSQLNAVGLTDEICRMQRFDMILSNKNTGSTNTFSVLLDRQSSNTNPSPKQLLARTRILHVDADGSPRSYHPEDPYGTGRCSKLIPMKGGGYKPVGVCALDTFSDGGVKVFQGTERLKGSYLEDKGRSLWPKIRDGTLKPFTTDNHSFQMPKNTISFIGRLAK